MLVGKFMSHNRKMSAPVSTFSDHDKNASYMRLSCIENARETIQKLADRNKREAKTTRRRPAPYLKRNDAAVLAGTSRQETWRDRIAAWKDVTSLSNNAYKLYEAQHGSDRKSLAERIGDEETAKMVRHIIQGNRDLSRAIQQRIKDGYVWHGGNISSKKFNYVKPFTEKGLRSDSFDILALMVSKTNRADRRWWMSHRVNTENRLKTGWDKEYIETQPRKIFGLDMPYLVWNETMRGVFRVDIDTDFESIEILENDLRRLGCPMPNVIVGSDKHKGEINSDRKIIHPHLYWVIRDSVCFTEKGRRRPKNTYLAIVNALINKLESIGADIGASRNGLRGKNPFSPHNNTWIIKEEPYRLSGKDPVDGDNLLSLAAELNLDTKNNFSTRIQTWKNDKTNQSNQPWHAALALARDHIQSWKLKSISMEMDDHDALQGFINTLNTLFIEVAPKNGKKTQEEWAEMISRKIGNHFWENYKFKSSQPGRPRGRPRKHPVEKTKSTRSPGRPRKIITEPETVKATRNPSQATLEKRQAEMEAANQRIADAADILAQGYPGYKTRYIPTLHINRRELAGLARVSTATLAHSVRIEAVEQIRLRKYEERMAEQNALKAEKIEKARLALKEKREKNILVKKALTVSKDEKRPQVQSSRWMNTEPKPCRTPVFDDINPNNLKSDPGNNHEFIQPNMKMWDLKLNLASRSKKNIRNRYGRNTGFAAFMHKKMLNRESKLLNI